jgi:hypothetical protein
MVQFDWHGGMITRATPVTSSYRNTQNVRRSLRAACGADFKFDRPFIQWIKDGTAKTVAWPDWVPRRRPSTSLRKLAYVGIQHHAISSFPRKRRASGNLEQCWERWPWVPAFAGMTKVGSHVRLLLHLVTRVWPTARAAGRWTPASAGEACLSAAVAKSLVSS